MAGRSGVGCAAGRVGVGAGVSVGAGAGVLLLLAAVVLPTLPTALAVPAPRSDGRQDARVMRVGATSNSNNVNNNNNNQEANNNYSVSFVPLFSLIANFLPKLLSRFAIKPPGSRSLGQSNDISKEFLQSKGIFCGPENIGRWKDITNCHQFYECKVNSDSPPGCQTVLSTSNGKQNEDYKYFTKDKSSKREEPVPILLDSYRNSCVTVNTYKCPAGHEYNDSLKQCIVEHTVDVS